MPRKSYLDSFDDDFKQVVAQQPKKSKKSYLDTFDDDFSSLTKASAKTSGPSSPKKNLFQQTGDFIGQAGKGTWGAVKSIPAFLQEEYGNMVQGMNNLHVQGKMDELRMADINYRRNNKLPARPLSFYDSPEWRQKAIGALERGNRSGVIQRSDKNAEVIAQKALAKQQQMKQRMDIRPGVGEFMYNTVGGLEKSAPALATSIVTKNPAPFLYGTGMMSYGDTYANVKRQGIPHEKAEKLSTISAGIDTAVNLIPIGKILNPSKEIVKDLVKQGITQGGLSVLGEGLKYGVEKHIINEQMTLKEAMERMGNAGLSGLITGVAMKGSADIAEVAGRKVFGGSPEEIQAHGEDGNVEAMKPENESEQSAEPITQETYKPKKIRLGQDVAWTDFNGKKQPGKYLGIENGSHVVEIEYQGKKYKVPVDEEDIEPIRPNLDNVEREKTEAFNIPMEERTFENVVDRNVPSYQFTHPELKDYIQAEAKRILKNDFMFTQKGQTSTNWEGTDIIKTGEKKNTTETIQRIQDTGKNVSYDDIRQALKDIIADNGAENHALAKKVELIIDDNLSNGFSDIDGQKWEPNQEYIVKKNAIENQKNASLDVERKTTPTTQEAPNNLVYNDIRSKLESQRPTDASPEEWSRQVDSAAQLWSKRIETEAARRGVSPEEVYRDMMRPEVTRGEMPEGTNGQTYDQSVYHGSGADFDRFNLNKIRTGVGQNLYGWGIYFTDRREMAEHYKDMLSGRAGTEGSLYKAEIPEDHELIDWDRPLREQSATVKEGLLRVLHDHPDMREHLGSTGEEFYQALSERLGGDMEASLVLREAGIPGAKRFTKLMNGTTNYAIWDEGSMPITEKNPGMYNQEGARGRVSLSSDRSVVQLLEKADPSTFMHESAHIWLEDMHRYMQSGRANEAYGQHWQTVADWLKIKEGQTELTRDQHEMFARGFEQYLQEGKAPTSALAQAFEAFKQWLAQIYKHADDLNVKINDDVRGFMDRMFATDEQISTEKLTFKTATPEEFIEQRDKSTKAQFLSPYTADDLAGKELYMTGDGVGYALTPEKDLVNVFNNSNRKGAGREAVVDAIGRGAKTLDCIADYLDKYYNNFGFVETGRDAWNDEYAPEGWDYETSGRPDIVYFKYPDELSRNPDDIRTRFGIARDKRASGWDGQFGVSELRSFTGEGEGRGLHPEEPEVPSEPTGVHREYVNQQDTNPSDKTGFSVSKNSHADMGGYADREVVPLPIEQPKENTAQATAPEAGTRIEKTMELPELVELAKQINDGRVPIVKEKLDKALGMFTPGSRNIKIRADLFKDPRAAAKTLAHEIGHLIDYLPDETMSRGNILGRIASLRHYLKTMIDALPTDPSAVFTEQERRKIRSLAEKMAHNNGGEVSDIYHELINKEAKRRGLISKSEVMDELKDLSMGWKPFDENVDPEFTKYRYSSPELYADAISVLLNDPGRLQIESPTFHDAFFNYLENKPEVKEAYEEIQDRINNPEKVNEKRLADIYEMQKRGNEARKRLNDRNQVSLEKVMDTLSRWLVDKNHGILKYVREGVKSKDARIAQMARKTRFELEETNHIASEAENYLYEIAHKVLGPLEENGLSVEDVGSYMFLDRVINERNELANPYGHTKETAQATMSQLKQKLGASKFAMMQRLVNAYRNIRKESIIPRMEAAKMYSPELMKQIKESEAYAKFSVLHYLEKKYGSGTTSKVYHQIGTLSDIENPLIATVVQDISALRAAKINEAKQATLGLLREVAPGSVEVAKHGAGGEIMDPKDPKKATMVVMEDGKLVGYHVDADIAECFETKPFEATQAAKIWSAFNRPLREALVAKNPFWMARNVIRDYIATVKNVPEIRLRDLTKLSKYYNQAFHEAWQEIFKNERSEDISTMMKKRMLSPERIYSGKDANYENDLERMVTEFSVSPYEAAQAKSARAKVKKVWDTLGKVGRLSEITGKIAGYKYLANETTKSQEEIGHLVRTRIGTPDARRVGKLHRFTNNIFMFSNINKEGMRSALESFNENRGAYVWKTIMFNVMPKLVLVGAAAAGPDWLKQCIKGIPDYDKLMYNIVPLGISKNGKSIYLRLPEDYEGQTFGALVWSIYQGKFTGQRGILDNVGQMSPYKLNPLIDVGSKLYQYFVQGLNPQDDYRGRGIVPDTAFKAGGLDSAKYMGEYTWKSLGGSVLYDPNKSEFGKDDGTIEKLLKFPPFNVLGTFLKYSDQGYSEEMYEEQGKEEKEKAQTTLAIRERVAESIKKSEPSYLNMTKLYRELKKEGIIPKDKSLSQFKTTYYSNVAHTVNDRDLAMVLRSRSNDDREEALKGMKERMPASRYHQLVSKLRKMGIAAR